MILKDKVAIVTGASRGIGRATAIELAKEGAWIVVNYIRSKDKAQEVVKEIEKVGSKAIAVKADVSKESEAKMLIDEALNKYGRIDILVNNAGVIESPSDYKNITEAVWNRTMDVNLKSVHNCIKLVAPIMIKQKSGKIVNLTSTYGVMGAVAVSAYTAAKAGVISLTRGFAKELAPYINVNAVAPGNIDTDMTQGAGKEFIKAVIDQTPFKRLGKAKEVADAIVFLSSPKADFITGMILVVDGGHCLR